MARRASASTPASDRSEATTLDPISSGNLASAWRLGHEVFGARVENWVLDRENSAVIAEGYSVAAPYDPSAVIALFSSRTRRVPLFPTLNYLEGQDPKPYQNGELIELTQDVQQFCKENDGNGTFSVPSWVDEAVKAYRDSHGLTGKRGPSRKNFHIDNLGNMTASDIAGLSKDILAHLANVAMEAQELSTSTETPSEEAVAASE